MVQYLQHSVPAGQQGHIAKGTVATRKDKQGDIKAAGRALRNKFRPRTGIVLHVMPPTQLYVCVLCVLHLHRIPLQATCLACACMGFASDGCARIVCVCIGNSYGCVFPLKSVRRTGRCAASPLHAAHGADIAPSHCASSMLPIHICIICSLDHTPLPSPSSVPQHLLALCFGSTQKLLLPSAIFAHDLGKWALGPRLGGVSLQSLEPWLFRP